MTVTSGKPGQGWSLAQKPGHPPWGGVRQVDSQAHRSPTESDSAFKIYLFKAYFVLLFKHSAIIDRGQHVSFRP